MKIQGALARTAVILVLAASGMVAFATIAPRPQANAPLQPTASVESMPIHADQVLPAPLSYIREERFQRGETLPGLLARLGVGEAEVPRLARLRALQQLHAGMLVRAEVTPEGAPRTLRFLTGSDAMMQIVADGDAYR